MWRALSAGYAYHAEREALRRRPDRPVLEQQILFRVCDVLFEPLLEWVLEDESLDEIGDGQAEKGSEHEHVEGNLAKDGRHVGARAEDHLSGQGGGGAHARGAATGV